MYYVQLLAGSLMPPVYAKSSASATSWRCWADGKERADASFPEWIRDDCVIIGKDKEKKIYLREFFDQDCSRFQDDKYFGDQYAIYYLVVQHQYLEVNESNKKFTNQSQIQIYIGSASNGVKKRWTEHCNGVREVLQAKSESSFRSCQVVDIFLALAWLRNFRMALFVVQCCDDFGKMEKAETFLIDKHEATSDEHGLNMKKGSTSTDETTTVKQPAK